MALRVAKTTWDQNYQTWTETDYWAACCEPGAEYPNPSLQKLLLNFQTIGQSVTIPSTLLSWVDITRKYSETLCVSTDPSDGQECRCHHCHNPCHHPFWISQNHKEMVMAKVKIRSMRHRLLTTRNGQDILLNIYVNLCKTSKLLFEGILF